MYTVGQFSKICNISIKTLHYYDEISLLKPAYVNPINDYRYYSYDQIKKIYIIGKLKEYEIPLQVIKRMLGSNDTFFWENVLHEQINLLEQKIMEFKKNIKDIETTLNQVKSNNPIVSVSTVSDCFFEDREETYLYGIRSMITLEEIDWQVKKLFEDIYIYGLETNGKLMAFFHNDKIVSNLVDVEVCIPIKKIDKQQISGVRILPGGMHICTIVEGPYSELHVGHSRVKDYIERHGYKIKSTPFEIYEEGLILLTKRKREIKPDIYRNPLTFITKICFPIFND